MKTGCLIKCQTKRTTIEFQGYLDNSDSLSREALQLRRGSWHVLRGDFLIGDRILALMKLWWEVEARAMASLLNFLFFQCFLSGLWPFYQIFFTRYRTTGCLTKPGFNFDWEEKRGLSIWRWRDGHVLHNDWSF
jgi:hypothetical protein